MRFHLFNWGGLLALVVLQAAIVMRLWSQLPPRVAIYFGISGRADGWGQPETLVLVMFASTAVLAACCHGLAAAIAALPASLFNIPDKAYWLSPERSAETRARVAVFLVVMGHVSVLFMCGVTHLALTANLTTPPRLATAFAHGLVAYLLFTFAWSYSLRDHFRRPEPSSKL